MTQSTSVGAVDLARAAADWLAAGTAVDRDDPSLYRGLAGVALALDEAHRELGDERYGHAAADAADALAEHVARLEDSSLCFGLTGVAVALHGLGRAADAERALARVRPEVAAHGMAELMAGPAGVGLGALRVGDVELALAAVAPYLTTADPTEHGVNWAVRPSPARSHHVAHGTLGIVWALAEVGAASGRDDLVDLALRGAADVVARNEDPVGFLVPHSDPPHRPELVERYSYGWCNGPAGDAQVFRVLRRVTGDEAWRELEDRCWHTVTHSGLPERLRPGFWDNHGRCCGTAGVLALATDRGEAFADVLVADLAAHAVVDEHGARWSNHEHREDPPELAPSAGWAMGSAGILPELLRYERSRSRSRDSVSSDSPSPSRR